MWRRSTGQSRFRSGRRSGSLDASTDGHQADEATAGRHNGTEAASSGTGHCRNPFNEYTNLENLTATGLDKFSSHLVSIWFSDLYEVAISVGHVAFFIT